MAAKFDITVRRKLTVNGKDYDSLDTVPPELRATLEKALASDAPASTTIMVNGKTFAALENAPAPLRAVVRGLAARALRDAGSPPAMVPEPIVSAKKVLVAVALAAFLYWLARRVF